MVKAIREDCVTKLGKIQKIYVLQSLDPIKHKPLTQTQRDIDRQIDKEGWYTDEIRSADFDHHHHQMTNVERLLVHHIVGIIA